MYLLLITRYIAKYHLVDLSLVKTGFKGQTEKSLRVKQGKFFEI